MGRTKSRKTIEATFSAEGMRYLAKEIHQYTHNVERANELFVHKLAEAGYKIATQQIVKSFPSLDHDKPIGSLDIITDNDGEIAGCKLQFSSEQALFIEFGAGIKYNDGVSHPYAGEYGYGVGTYPNQKHAYDKGGWSYQGEDGSWHHSYGTKATMPMYSATQEIIEQFVRIAREVYQGVL